MGPSAFQEEIRHLGSGAFGSAVLVRRIKDGRRLVAKKCSVKAGGKKQGKGDRWVIFCVNECWLYVYI